MSATYAIQASFNRGEISPLLRSRFDADFWKMSLETCENFAVLLHGGLRRRSGTRFVGEVYDSTAISRVFPFIFSNAQSYVLEISGAGQIEFYASRGVLGAPYTVSHSWAEGDIYDLTYTQIADVADFAHESYAPQHLSRLGDTSWTLADSVFNDGPYLPETTSGTTLTPASTGGITPLMTSNTLPSGTAAATGGAADAFEVFDRDVSTDLNIAAISGFVSYDFAGTATKVADGYWLAAPRTEPEKTPTNWVFEGYDGSTWIVLDTQIDQIGWTAGERRYFTFDNSVGYQSYRFTWTNVDGGATTKIQAIEIHEAGTTQTAFNLTASAVTGINDSTGFQTSDVGRTIRLYGTDGRWRWARIIARTSTTIVTIQLFGDALPDLSPIKRWALGAFSGYSGFPGLVALFNNRLAWARTDAQPVSVWFSSSIDREFYGYSVPVVATDAVAVTLLSADMNELNFLAGDEDLITGSARQIRSIGPDDITQGFSALNVGQRKGPSSGAYRLHPLLIGSTVLYVGAGGRKIRELVLGDQNRYVAPELSLIGEHVFASGIKDWAFSENPEPTVFAVTRDGELVAMLYDREQRAVGFARFNFGDGIAESLAVIPSGTEGYDDVYLVIRRTIGGVTKRYVEVLERPFDHINDDVEDAYFVDCGLAYNDPLNPVTGLSGLDHLEGEDVVALADGAVVTGLTVTGGAITLPFAAGIVCAGLEYESRAVTLPMAGPAADGVLFGRRVNITSVKVDLLATGSLSVGAAGSDDWTPDDFEINPHTADEITGNPVTLISGVQRADIEGSWAEGEGRIVMSTSKPLPAIVRSIILQAESEP